MFTKERRHLVVDKEDIMTVMEVLDEIKRSTKGLFRIRAYEIEMGNCGWSEYPDKWYIFFTMKNKKWSVFINELGKRNRKLILKEDHRIYLN